MKEKLVAFLEKESGLKLDFESLLEVPKHTNQGDLALPVFTLAKELKKSPIQIAQELAENLNKKKKDFLESVIATGPYVNFTFDKKALAQDLYSQITKKEFGVFKKKKEKILIEYPSPNTNKSLHIGHVRNILLGNSLTRILKETGLGVVTTSINNDRGIAICKSILAYQKFGEGRTPKDLSLKADKFAEHFYVLYGEKVKEDSQLDEEAQAMLVKWESGDKEVVALWKKLLSWVYEGYKETYSKYKVKLDKEYYESEIYDKGRDIVLDALKRKVKGFQKDENGAVLVDLEDVKLDKKYLLRSDGTTVYMTQDLYLAYLKEKDFDANKYIFIVGEEQKYHFEVLFEILGRLGFGGVERNYHLAYGYVYDEKGEKFSSRKGRVIRADELIKEVEEKARKSLLDKEISKNLSEQELERRAETIAYAGLAFFILKANPQSSIHFSTEQALSFEGESGPYVLYTYARIQSLLKKVGKKGTLSTSFEKVTELELSILKKVAEFPELLEESANKYKPSHLCHYLLQLAQMTNDLYQNVPVLKEEDKKYQAQLLMIFTQSGKVLKRGLEVLDIEVLDEM